MDNFERRLLTDFMVSDDYLRRQHEASPTVSFVGYRLPCSNPYAKVRRAGLMSRPRQRSPNWGTALVRPTSAAQNQYRTRTGSGYQGRHRRAQERQNRPAGAGCVGAHGVSVIEVKKDAQGQWQRVMPSRYNRRILAMTPMAVSGPLAGHEALKTASDPNGEAIIGTLNNCSSGITPWGTYLVCEENWHHYFVNHDADDLAQRVSHKRYGIEGKGLSKLYGWGTADPRFNATPDPMQPYVGHV